MIKGDFKYMYVQKISEKGAFKKLCACQKTTSVNKTKLLPVMIMILKVPKREIFVTELFILSDPIWVGDLRTEPKKTFV